jgi:hypothetical protein
LFSSRFLPNQIVWFCLSRVNLIFFGEKHYQKPNIISSPQNYILKIKQNDWQTGKNHLNNCIP